MYGCDSHIGCLSGSITRVGVDSPEGLSGSIRRIGGELIGSVSCLNKGLKGYVSMVCSVSKDAYLNVSTETLWLTPDMIAEQFEIYSNVKWVINVPEIEEPESMVLESLSNDTLLANDTLLRNADVTAISVLDNGTLVYNNYYFISYEEYNK